MIAYMPGIYEDELCYSWFARYYCHSGYPAYGYALDDLFGKRTVHFSAEYISSRFSEDAKEIIHHMIPMERLILGHTMFPVARFMNHGRMQKALECMARQEGKAGDLLPLPKSKTPRYLRYCPCCAKEQREKHNEAFWTRVANIFHLDICAKHQCRLKNTNIILSGRQSPRLYAAEHEIEDMEPEYVQDGLELKFSKYLTDVFQSPIDFNNHVRIADFLQSRLEGTKYLSASGIKRNIALLCSDMKEFYLGMPDKGITEIAQVQKVFTGYSFGLYGICQIAFFLGISAGELTAPALPEKSQEQVFKEKVAELKSQGLSAKQIGRMLGIDHHSVQDSGKVKVRVVHDHAVRKGMHNEDWTEMDERMLPVVKETCQKMYHGEKGTPQRVTAGAVERVLHMPSKRLRYLPKCRKEIQKYEEPQEIFWARKIVWQYRRLEADRVNISCNKLCRPLNLRKENFISALDYLERFCGEEEGRRIRGLV